MRYSILVVVVAVLSGCGVDTATSVGAGASIKKQEVEEGKRTESRAQQKIEQMREQMQQRAQEAGGKE